MYYALLTLHSYTRWFVLISVVITIFFAARGWINKRKYSAFDNRMKNIAVSVVHIQFLIGLTLYSISPIVRYLLQHFSKAVHEREIRFFGMEHSSMMLIAVTLITIGSGKAKRETNDVRKFKTLCVWFTIALLVILSSIPWPFTGLVSRPYFRAF